MQWVWEKPRIDIGKCVEYNEIDRCTERDGEDMKKDDEMLLLGLFLVAGAVLCFTCLKNETMSILGFLSFRWKTVGWILLICGGFNLLAAVDKPSDLLYLPLIPVFWLIEHWYIALALVAALFLFKGDELFDGSSFLGKQDMTAQQTQTEETEARNTITSEDTQYRPRWNTGVCQNLAEDVCIVALFINDPEKEWADYTINWFLENKVEPGLRFISEEAAEYGQNIQVEYLTYTGVTTKENVLSYNSQHGGNVFDVLEEAANSLGFASSHEMLEYHREYSGIEQIVYMLCSNKNGRPYAYSSGSADPDALECCVVFCNSENSAASSYNTIFHEVLHLFGAMDYYAEGTERVNREKMAKQLCPNDIMLNSYDAGLRDIGAFTAYCIGWLDEMPAEYNTPEWWS